MYGIVNKAIQDLVTEKYSKSIWNQVRKKAGVEEEIFLSHTPYPDEITYALAKATAEILDAPVYDILSAFGEYWVLKTGLEKYGSLLKAGGLELREFLNNLPHFHSRVMLIYPDLTPPEFKIESLSRDLIEVHYFSHRDGLTGFMHGLLIGLSAMYQTKTKIVVKERKDQGAPHDIFHVQILS